MESTKGFRNLIVWQKAHQLVLDIYKMTLILPSEEKFGVINQIKRCAVSVPSNISESFGRIGLKDKIRFLNIANGSLEETKYFLILIQDLEFTNTNHLMENAEEVSKILNAYISTMRKGL